MSLLFCGVICRVWAEHPIEDCEFQVQVELLFDSTRSPSFLVTPLTLVQTLKEWIAEDWELSVPFQRLSHDGIVLENQKSLGHYHVVTESTLGLDIEFCGQGEFKNQLFIRSSHFIAPLYMKPTSTIMECKEKIHIMHLVDPGSCVLIRLGGHPLNDDLQLGQIRLQDGDTLFLASLDELSPVPPTDGVSSTKTVAMGLMAPGGIAGMQLSPIVPVPVVTPIRSDTIAIQARPWSQLHPQQQQLPREFQLVADSEVETDAEADAEMAMVMAMAIVPGQELRFRSKLGSVASVEAAEWASAELWQGVWRGTPVQIKRYPPPSHASQTRAFMSEIGLLLRVRHPRLHAFLCATIDTSQACVVNELTASTLHSLVHSNSAPGVTTTTSGMTHTHTNGLGLGLLPIMRDAALGLAFLEASGIVHGSLRSKSIRVNFDGRGVVGDLGQSHSLPLDGYGYAAPEVLRRRRQRPHGPTPSSSVDTEPDADADANAGADAGADAGTHADRDRAPARPSSVDVYSFGVCLWEMITGEELADSTELAQVGGRRLPLPSSSAASSPAWLNDLVASCLGPPRNRPTFSVVVEALHRGMALEAGGKFEGKTKGESAPETDATAKARAIPDEKGKTVSKKIAAPPPGGVGTISGSNPFTPPAATNRHSQLQPPMRTRGPMPTLAFAPVPAPMSVPMSMSMHMPMHMPATMQGQTQAQTPGIQHQHRHPMRMSMPMPMPMPIPMSALSVATPSSTSMNYGICPLSQRIMTDPVIASDGYTYDRRAIEAWLHSFDVSPTTGLPLRSKRLVPNDEMRIDVQHASKHASTSRMSSRKHMSGNGHE